MKRKLTGMVLVASMALGMAGSAGAEEAGEKVFRYSVLTEPTTLDPNKASGDYEVAFGGWGPDYSDPYTYLELFKSDCSYNYSNYSNTEFDQLLDASKTETDVQARMDMLNEAEKIILEDAAFISLQCRQEHYLLNEKVTGVAFYFCSVNIDWVYADIAE